MASSTEIKEFKPQPKKFLHLRCMYGMLFFLEEKLKELMFDCRSCGQCILSTTGFVCPMRCPKELRNGPCGGSQDGQCEVDSGKRCVWNEIFEGTEALNRINMLYGFQVPTDKQLKDTSAVVNYADQRIEGMKLALPGKGNMLGQLLRILFRIIKIRWRKLIHPSRYWFKYESHYKGA
ncbi:MAG: methylenetetrahydrofolate reductase C-terminal domain-containing protein [Actinomycetota bacterium]|nr:methylenetetrahydrofolate reductase C-terminal domain-containing protein [Actinomycetota bacterium]